MSDKKEKFARAGIATKGIVYCLMGGLAAMTAIGGTGGKTTGSSGIIEYISNQKFGQILVAMVAVGLVGYVFYRLYQTFFASLKDEDGAKETVKRIGYFISAVSYGFLTYHAFKIVTGSGGGGGQGKQGYIADLLNKPFGQIMVGIIGAVFIGYGIYQIYRVVSGDYKENLEKSALKDKIYKLLLNSGKVGYIARGTVLGLIGFFIVKAAWTANSSQVGGVSKAFDFLRSEGGTIVFLVVALGLLGYGIFQIVTARYKKLEI
ncbi:MAG: DUF1206 domain-containing protein [Cyclobacteriaceae bacterium]